MLAVIVTILIAALIIDLSISDISDIVKVSPLTAPFILLTGLSVVSQYFILQGVKNRSKEITSKNSDSRHIHLNVLNRIVLLTQYYVLIPLVLIVILQIILNVRYYVFLLNVVMTVSYLMGITIICLLSFRFFKWFFKSSSSRRSIMVLIYGFATASTAMAMIFTFVFYEAILLTNKTPTIGPQSEVSFPQFYTNSFLRMLNNIYGMFNVVSFSLLWISTVLLLHHYSNRFGFLKFWIVLSIPLGFFFSQFVTLSSVTRVNAADIFLITLYTLQGLAGGVMFGLPFLALSKRVSSIPYHKGLRDYMSIAAYGFILLFVSGTATIVQTPYPPFGLASISAVGLSSYLIFVGLYYSAVAISQDVKLRQVIREEQDELEQSKFLDSIGSAHMEQEIVRRVMNIAKDQQEQMHEEAEIGTSSFSSSLTEEDVKDYLRQVLKEIKNSKAEKEGEH